jgi:hypothetical protein
LVPGAMPSALRLVVQHAKGVLQLFHRFLGKKHANLNLMLFQGSPNSDGSLPDPVPKPSALRVAILRAAHQLLDTPLIFDDPLARQILGAGEEALLRSELRTSQRWGSILDSLAYQAHPTHQERVEGD